ncbi:riboflavin kinase [Winogradskya humida]|uniref:riboflavin kinase n=1 Tax=Winogradskya humida TaxID=113566 RepID=A0ABQ3ZI83_9ACTN|nr:riboflavin kinase [Actinoplanes humidus]GIE18301.1 hypothetical protein Ahu01nite_014030 [Actinoplanes humidus]
MTIKGPVVTGAGRGRDLGFPTANIGVEDEASIPADGVYLAWFALDGGPDRAALLSVGTNPTFDGDRRTAEAYVLDVDEDMYGRHAQVRIVTLIRGQIKFDSIDALITQMQADERRGRELLAGLGDGEPR